MNHYGPRDFSSYYAGSWIVHPETKAIVSVVRVGSDGVVTLADKSTVNLKDIDWEHVVTPQLGYRHVDNGRMVYYLYRSAARRVAKGLTPEALMIRACAVAGAAARQLSGKGMPVAYQLDGKLAKEIHANKFMKLPYAIKALKSAGAAVGFALSPSFAVGLGLHADKAFIISYKTIPVAFSSDGDSWEFVDEDAEWIFNRSFHE